MITDNPLVSIIVPIYNAADYLEECLISISSQTYKNIEVILINDGSTDDSYHIAELFCKKDIRFKLFDQRNAGVAAARQRGLKIAQGEFVIHTDSDDLMAAKGIEYLYESIVHNNSDIAVGSYIIQSEKGEEFVSHLSSDKDSFTTSMLSGKYRGVLWNKLIKMELCKDISFDENINYMEDLLFLAKILRKSDVSLSVTNEVVYFYRMVAGSYTNNITYDSILSSMNVVEQISSIFKDIYSEKFIAHIKNKNKVMVLLNSNQTQRNTFSESTKYLLQDRKIPLKHKMVILFDLMNMNYPIEIYKSVGRKMARRSI